MSLLKIRRDRTSYGAPVVKLAVSLAAVLAVRIAELVINANFDGKYDAPARVVFCVAAAVGAILCYQALMEIGYIYDNRHPNAASSVGAVDMTVDEVMEAVAGESFSHAAILIEDQTLIVGSRAKSAASEDFTRVYFVGNDELADENELREKLVDVAKDGKLSVAAIDELTGKKYARRIRAKQAEKNRSEK